MFSISSKDPNKRATAAELLKIEFISDLPPGLKDIIRKEAERMRDYWVPAQRLAIEASVARVAAHVHARSAKQEPMPKEEIKNTFTVVSLGSNAMRVPRAQDEVPREQDQEPLQTPAKDERNLDRISSIKEGVEIRMAAAQAIE